MSIRVKKSLGQHFLKDVALAQQIVDLLTDAARSRTVIEVGPGRGILTDWLVQKAIERLYLVEIDSDLIPYLRKRYDAYKEHILEADFLTLALSEQFHGERLTLIGNFPYNISSQIFFKILSNRHIVDEVVCMVQKEVAQRLVASPGNKVYGIPSVLLQAFYTIEYCFTIPPDVFFPPPKVDSAVVKMRRNHVTHLSCNESLFFEIVKKSFQQRRKKLQNALHSFTLDKRACQDLMQKRAEELSVADFIQLTHALMA